MADDEGRRIPYRPTLYEPADMDARAAEFLAEMDGRRSVRAFSPEPVPRRLIELAIKTASTAPSGAHQQPWTFVAVGDPDTKRRIRIAAEAEERRSYSEQVHGAFPDGSHRKHYYARESVGIAAGLLVAAIHHMGLATLTHTPSPMGFLTQILERPRSERPLVLFPVGFPADDASVPDLRRKSLEEIAVFDPPLADPDEDE